MRAELEQYLEELRGSLEVETDLNGSRTGWAQALRLAIIATEAELATMKVEA